MDKEYERPTTLPHDFKASRDNTEWALKYIFWAVCLAIAAGAWYGLIWLVFTLTEG